MTIRAIAFLLFFASSHLWADVKLPAVLSDGMVLQREATVPIWGWGKSGDSVIVKFAEQSAEGVVKADGSWRVDLKPLEASSANRSMTVTVGADTVTLNDVVVGEVWLASGQSNMQMTLDESGRKTLDEKDQQVAWSIKEEIGMNLDPMIRQLKVPIATSYDKELTQFESEWAKADTVKNKNQFSAVGYYFAKELRKNLDVPVGVMHPMQAP